MAEPCVIKILGADATGFPAVNYNENKVAEGMAKLVKMKNFGLLERYQFHAADTVKKFLQKIADRNDRVQHPQLHIMVSYPGIPTEEEKQKLLKDLEDTLDRLGYIGQPVLIYAHYDTDHWHLHAVSSRVQQGTGRWINNSFEGVRARQHLDEIRGVEHDKALDKMLNYNFTSKEQFLHILRANGYHFQEDAGVLNVYRACEHVFGLSILEIEETGEANKIKNKKNRKEQLNRIRQVRAIISKYRDKSLNVIVDVPELKKTKRGKVHTVVRTKAEVKRAKFPGSDGLDLSDLKKAQFKIFLTDLKRTAGVELVFHRDMDGKVRGYSIIDNAKGNIFNGSDVMKMPALLNGKNMMEEIIPEELAAEVSQEYRAERNAERDKIDPSNVFDKMMERLSSMGLKYDDPPLMRPYVSELSALQNCQKAIELITLAETQKENGDENWVMNAQKAVEHAEGAAQMDRHDKESKKQAYESENKQKQTSKSGIQGARIIPFVKIEPTIFFGDDRRIYIKVDVNGKAYQPKAISAEHSAWYQQQVNYEQAAQDLALHYYANEIQKVQVNGWKEQYFEAGKMPFGITVGEVWGHANNQGDRFWVDGDFTRDGQKLKTLSQEVFRNEYVKFINSEGVTARSVVCKSVGRELVKDWEFNSITDIKNALFDSPSPESSVDGMWESVQTFETFTEKLCNDFMETCGATAIAYFNAILPSGQSIGGGGGGQSTGNWGGKKDDDDLYKRSGGIMGFKPSKKKTGGGLKM